MTFKYYQPSKDLGPTHTPEKVKNPGNWRYYDLDLDAVRGEIARNVYLGGALEREKFIEHEEFMNILTTYLDKVKNRKPEAGEYNP